VVHDLIADYDKLATPDVDDVVWTFHCIQTLRPFSCVHCVRVIRLVIHEMLRRDMGSETRESTGSEHVATDAASPKSHHRTHDGPLA
jgi:hypothetical protein